ncbi:5'(3')-deoxyribonucleotidase, cytosolic type-like [Antedon mediterranea]|uniref:5'(3')-deoxyribonucleotidase, cytosolic type-like n=1 Tax=Antedon mediterranea TaxID=105859 RepID=UPI003AF5F78D
MFSRFSHILNRSTAGELLYNTKHLSGNVGLKHPLKVLVSLDGCVADSEDYFLREYRRRYPLEPYVRVEERQKIPLAHQYGRLRPDLVQHVESILKTPGFYVKMAPITGAIQALTEMQNNEQLDVYIMVCPIQNSPKALHEKFQWIKTHLGQVFLEHLIVVKDNYMIQADVHFSRKESNEGNTFSLEATRISGNLKTDFAWTDDTWRNILRMKDKEIIKNARVEQ